MLIYSISVSIWVATVPKESESTIAQSEGILCFIMSDVERTMSLSYRGEGRHYSS